jgi:hypothetical protein
MKKSKTRNHKETNVEEVINRRGLINSVLNFSVVLSV